MRQLPRTVILGALATLLISAPVNAGKPMMERINVDDHVVDNDLSAACGVTVRADVTGHAIFRLFLDAAGNPVREVNNFAIDVRWSSVNGEIHAKDVGVDRVEYLDDGGRLQFIIGSVQSFSIPGQGRVYADVGRTMVEIDAAGNATVTPLGGQHDPDQLGAICSVLGN